MYTLTTICVISALFLQHKNDHNDYNDEDCDGYYYETSYNSTNNGINVGSCSKNNEIIKYAQPDREEWRDGVWRSAEREGERVAREGGGLRSDTFTWGKRQNFCDI